jgi:lipid II:glycine glycyltransferase (peptidoglycan interpeptide bridge formation enzyme)
MSAPRRRLIRPVPEPVAMPDRSRQIQRLRDRLEKERAVLARWQTKMKRAFNAVTKSQKCIARIERQLNHLEE